MQFQCCSITGLVPFSLTLPVWIVFVRLVTLRQRRSLSCSNSSNLSVVKLSQLCVNCFVSLVFIVAVSLVSWSSVKKCVDFMCDNERNFYGKPYDKWVSFFCNCVALALFKELFIRLRCSSCSSRRFVDALRCYGSITLWLLSKAFSVWFLLYQYRTAYNKFYGHSSVDFTFNKLELLLLYILNSRVFVIFFES